MTNQEFIDMVGPMAQRDWQKHKVLPSVTVAQAILESGWGKSTLAVKGKALFGIKAGTDWKGKQMNCKTFEVYDGNRVDIVDAFRAYDSWEESVEDHGAFLAGLARYRNLIGLTDYAKVCRLLQEDGYATAPNYAQTLTGLIESYRLTRYDKAAAAGPWVQSYSYRTRQDAQVVAETLETLGFTALPEEYQGGYRVKVVGLKDYAQAKALADVLSKARFAQAYAV